jgi:hypothetical protein
MYIESFQFVVGCSASATESRSPQVAGIDHRALRALGLPWSSKVRNLVLRFGASLAGMLCFGIASAHARSRVSQPEGIACTVELAQVVRTIPATLFGTNLEWAYNADGISGTDGSVASGWTNLMQQMGVSTIRFPGGTLSDFYNWQDGVGPESARPVVQVPTPLVRANWRATPDHGQRRHGHGCGSGRLGCLLQPAWKRPADGGRPSQPRQYQALGSGK